MSDRVALVFRHGFFSAADCLTFLKLCFRCRAFPANPPSPYPPAPAGTCRRGFFVAVSLLGVRPPWCSLRRQPSAKQWQKIECLATVRGISHEDVRLDIASLARGWSSIG